MRRTDILRNILKTAKTDDIFMLDVDILSWPGDTDVQALPLDDRDGNIVGIVIQHHFPSPVSDADWAAPIWTDDEVFKLTPPKRFR